MVSVKYKKIKSYPSLHCQKFSLGVRETCNNHCNAQQASYYHCGISLATAGLSLEGERSDSQNRRSSSKLSRQMSQVLEAQEDTACLGNYNTCSMCKTNWPQIKLKRLLEARGLTKLSGNHAKGVKDLERGLQRVTRRICQVLLVIVTTSFSVTPVHSLSLQYLQLTMSDIIQYLFPHL